MLDAATIRADCPPWIFPTPKTEADFLHRKADDDFFSGIRFFYSHIHRQATVVGCISRPNEEPLFDLLPKPLQAELAAHKVFLELVAMLPAFFAISVRL